MEKSKTENEKIKNGEIKNGPQDIRHFDLSAMLKLLLKKYGEHFFCNFGDSGLRFM
jgi:hypothetical protein